AVFTSDQGICPGVVECFLGCVEAELLAGPESDVADVAEPRAAMADFDFSSRIRPALDAVQEILDVQRLAVVSAVAVRAVAFFDSPAMVVDDQRPLVTVEGDAESAPFGRMLGPHTVLPGEARAGEFPGHKLGVGHLLVIVENVLAAA